MKHLLTIKKIEHTRKGKVLWEAKDIKNVLHSQGEEYILSCLFNTLSVSVGNYYLGLDNRTTPSISDNLPNGLLGEPSSNTGYIRQLLSPVTGFTIQESDGVYTALSNIVSFSASGGAWGPIRNMFLTNLIDNSGYLIATAALGAELVVNDGDTITVQISLSLRDSSVYV